MASGSFSLGESMTYPEPLTPTERRRSNLMMLIIGLGVLALYVLAWAI